MDSTSYTNLRKNLPEIWDKVEASQEPVIVERRGHQTMAILPAEELDGLRETAHLLRSPRNAVRLLTALQRAFVSHLAHHRAQLGVYLRMLDVPVPSSYGPTADEGPPPR